MNNSKVVLGIATLERPLMLGRCLASLKNLIVPESVHLILIVVDNDPQGSARATFDTAVEGLHFSCYFLIEPQQGIVHARNCLLREGAVFMPDFYCFIDDDEEVTSGWLTNHIKAIKEFQADVTAGSVERNFEGTVSKWISSSQLLDKSHHLQGEIRTSASTANVLFSARLISEWGLSFDHRLNLTGSSDSLFFEQAYRRGAKIVWVEQAVVYEFFPRSRMTLQWLMKRNFREANTEVLRQRIMGASLGVYMRQIALVINDFLDCTVMAPLRLVRGRYKVIKSLLSLSRVFGRLAGLMGFYYKEYTTIHGH